MATGPCLPFPRSPGGAGGGGRGGTNAGGGAGAEDEDRGTRGGAARRRVTVRRAGAATHGQGRRPTDKPETEPQRGFAGGTYNGRSGTRVPGRQT